MRKLLKVADGNEDVGVFLWYLGVKLTIQDDKTSVPIVCSVHISGISHSIVDNVGNYIFSDGKDGCGYHSVALHDATFFHSTFHDHCASLLSYLFSDI